MTDALSPTVPAGWYPDPWGSTSQRWWDGSAWSGRLFPQPDATAPDAIVPDASTPAPNLDSPLPSRRALREMAAAADGPPSDMAADAAAEVAPTPPEPAAVRAQPLPAFTQVPEFTPEPVSALPPPVWVEPEAPAPAPSAEPVVRAAAVEPAAVVASVTSHITSPGAPPIPVTSPVADDGWAASLSSWGEEDMTDPPDPLPIFGDSPPISYSQRAMRYKPLHGRTSPVWLIVFLPIIHAAAVAGSMLLFPRAFILDGPVLMVTPAALANPAVLGEWLLFAAAPLGVAFFLFTLIMGFQDRARLRRLGHEQTASPWWILLHPFVYLIVRTVRVRQCTGRRGSGPLTTYLCLYFAPPIALIVATAVISALDGAIPA